MYKVHDSEHVFVLDGGNELTFTHALLLLRLYHLDNSFGVAQALPRLSEGLFRVLMVKVTYKLGKAGGFLVEVFLRF